MMLTKGDRVSVSWPDREHQHLATFVGQASEDYVLVKFVDPALRNSTTGGIDTVHRSRVTHDINYQHKFGLDED
jgi:hypothetical protein